MNPKYQGEKLAHILTEKYKKDMKEAKKEIRKLRRLYQKDDSKKINQRIADLCAIIEHRKALIRHLRDIKAE